MTHSEILKVAHTKQAVGLDTAWEVGKNFIPGYGFVDAAQNFSQGNWGRGLLNAGMGALSFAFPAAYGLRTIGKLGLTGLGKVMPSTAKGLGAVGKHLIDKPVNAVGQRMAAKGITQGIAGAGILGGTMGNAGLTNRAAGIAADRAAMQSNAMSARNMLTSAQGMSTDMMNAVPGQGNPLQALQGFGGSALAGMV